MTTSEIKPAWNEEDSQGTDEIVCPHCGYEIPESREFPGKSGFLTCDNDNCKERFAWSRNTSITYSAKRLGQ